MTEQNQIEETASAIQLRRAVERGVSGLDQTTKEAVERLSSQGGTLIEILSLLEGADKDGGPDPMTVQLEQIADALTAMDSRLATIEARQKTIGRWLRDGRS